MKKARGGDTPQILAAPGGEDPSGIPKSPGISRMTNELAFLEPAPSTTDTSQESKDGAFNHNGGENSADVRSEENPKELQETKAEPMKAHADEVRDTKEEHER